MTDAGWTKWAMQLSSGPFSISHREPLARILIAHTNPTWSNDLANECYGVGDRLAVVISSSPWASLPIHVPVGRQSPQMSQPGGLPTPPDDDDTPIRVRRTPATPI